MHIGNQPNLGRNFLLQHNSRQGLFVLGRIIAFIVILLGLSRPSMAQFVVQPMKFNLTVRGGQTFKKQILIQNYGSAENRPVGLDVVDLGQNEKGDWTTLADIQSDPNGPQQGISCRSWLKLNKKNITLQGEDSQEVEMTVRVPAGVRGFYCAAIRATVAPLPGAGAVSIKYQMIVPVLVEVEGIPLSNHVSLDDVEVAPIAGSDGKGSTELSFSVSNTGNTMASVLGKGWVKYWDDHKQRWKPVVSEIDMVNNILIPGTKAIFRQDIGKELPSGRYRLMGMLNVGGRESGVFDKEIQFAGKADTTLVEDSAIRCDRDFVQIEGQMGRTRRSTVELRNYSLNPITIRASAETPKEMAGKIWYGRKGDDMSCANWIEVRPEEVKLQPFGSRNVSVVAKIPAGKYRSEGYYADLTFKAQYEGGGNAGSATVLTCVQDKDIKHDLKIQANGLKLNRLDGPGERFIVGATYGNLSDIHVVPQVRARLVAVASQQAMKEWNLVNSAETQVLLPYEKRTFSAVIGLSNLDEGDYQLSSEFVSDGEVVASIQKPLKIYREGGQRIVEVTASAPDQTEAGSEAPTYSW